MPLIIIVKGFFVIHFCIIFLFALCLFFQGIIDHRLIFNLLPKLDFDTFMKLSIALTINVRPISAKGILIAFTINTVSKSEMILRRQGEGDEAYY